MKNWLLFYFLLSFTALSAQSPEIETLKEIVSKKEILPDTDTTVLAALDDLFEYYHYLYDTTQTQYYSDLLIREAKNKGHDRYEKQGCINKARSYMITDRTKGKILIDSLLPIIKETSDNRLLAQCYIYLGGNALRQNLRDTNTYFFRQALAVLDKEKNSKESIEAYRGLAYVIVNKGGRVKEGLALINIGLEKARILGNKILITKMLSKAIGYNYVTNNYDKASTLVIEAIKFAEEQHYVNSDLFENYGIIADLYWVKNSNIQKARMYINRAYELSKTYHDNVTKILTSLGFAYYNIVGDNPDLTLAEELSHSSLEKSIKSNYKFGKSKSHFYLGMVYSAKDSFEQAYPHYIESIQIAEKINNKSYSLRIQAHLAKEIKSKNIDKPIFLDTSKQELKTLDSKIWFYKIKKDIALQNQDYKAAFSALEKLKEYELEDRAEQCKINIEERLLACELEEQTEKLALKEELVANTTFKNQLLSVASMVALLFLGIFYFLYRTKNRLNQEITQKNEKISANSKQLAVFNKDLASKNDLLAKKNTLQEKEIVDFIAFQNKRDYELSHIKTEITKAIASNTPNVTALQLLNNKVSQLISNENDWLYFKQKITSLYPNFFNNLLLRHTNLNEREQLHCAYILLGMSVKKVAESIFVSIKAVESARYRIKKKMDLGKTDNLSEYIRNFGTRQY